MPSTKSKKRQRAAGRRGEIVFDPEARKDYLRGFSERKRKRRAFGLAMQKVKDRKAKLEQRAEEKLAIQEQIEEAEKQKQDLLEGLFEENETSIVRALPVADEQKPAAEEKFENVQTYQDVQTQSQWGGEVVVTTSTHIPGDSDDESASKEEQQQKQRRQESKQKGRKKEKAKSTVDAEQEYAGNVERFMHELKGNMPGKKKRDHGHKQKGKYGAANMKGMAKGGDFKIAQKALQRSQAKQKGGKGGGKRKR